MEQRRLALRNSFPCYIAQKPKRRYLDEQKVCQLYGWPLHSSWRSPITFIRFYYSAGRLQECSHQQIRDDYLDDFFQKQTALYLRKNGYNKRHSHLAMNDWKDLCFYINIRLWTLRTSWLRSLEVICSLWNRCRLPPLLFLCAEVRRRKRSMLNCFWCCTGRIWRGLNWSWSKDRRSGWSMLRSENLSDTSWFCMRLKISRSSVHYLCFGGYSWPRGWECILQMSFPPLS